MSAKGGAVGGRKLTLLGLPVLICFTTATIAESPRGTLRAFAAYAKPTSEFRGVLPGIVADITIEAQGTPGLGITYELRPLDWLGIELGVMAADFDFDITFDTGNNNPVDTGFGSALMTPLLAATNFHFTSGERLDLHVGVLASYTMWGDFDFDSGSSGDLDDEFSFGAKFGLDTKTKGNSGFSLSVVYLPAATENPSLSIDVDPIFIEFGYYHNFQRR